MSNDPSDTVSSERHRQPARAALDALIDDGKAPIILAVPGNYPERLHQELRRLLQRIANYRVDHDRGKETGRMTLVYEEEI